MNHLIRFWVLIECTHLVVFGVVIVRRHDGQECLSAILEFEHIIERERRANIAIHYKNERWITLHNLLFMLVECRNSQLLTCVVLLLNVLDREAELGNHGVNERQEVVILVFSVKVDIFHHVLARKFG